MLSFAAPVWPDVDVTFDVPAAEVAVALEAAAKSRDYSEPRGRDSLGYLRLGGTVAGRTLALTAKLHLTPGIPQGRSLTLHITGTVVDSHPGSHLIGKLSAPIPRYVPVVLGAWLVFLLIVGPNSLAAAALFAPIVPAWWLILRYNQRQAVRRIGDVRAFLAQIIESRRVTLAVAD